MITKRSIAIEGSVTSVSLEPEFWIEIERQAAIAGVSWQNFFRELVIDVGPDVNRSSAIREILMRRLRDELFRCSQYQKISRWRLRSPDGAREIAAVGPTLYVGREPGNDVVIDDQEVSRKHLLLSWDGQNWWAVDLDSKNGLRLDNRVIRVSRIKKGATLSLGRSELTLIG